MFLHFHETELWEYASVTAIAVNSPKEVRKLEPKRRFNLDPEMVPGMLRIPKKKPVG